MGLGGNHRAQPAACRQDGAGQRLAAQFNAVVLGQHRALPIHRQMLLILPGQHLDNKIIGQLALGHNLRRHRRRHDALFVQAMGAALFALDHAHEEPGRFAGQFVPRLVADYRTLGPALGATAVLRTAGDNLFTPLQVLRQFFASGMLGTGLPGPGQRLLLLLLRQLSLLGHFLGGDAGLFQQQQRLIGGKLFALGSPEFQVEPADFLLLQLDDKLQALVLRFGPFQGLAQGGKSRIRGDHLIRVSYI